MLACADTRAKFSQESAGGNMTEAIVDVRDCDFSNQVNYVLHLGCVGTNLKNPTHEKRGLLLLMTRLKPFVDGRDCDFSNQVRQVQRLRGV
jgi:hypothetical protein